MPRMARTCPSGKVMAPSAAMATPDRSDPVDEVRQGTRLKLSRRRRGSPCCLVMGILQWGGDQRAGRVVVSTARIAPQLPGEGLSASAREGIHGEEDEGG